MGLCCYTDKEYTELKQYYVISPEIAITHHFEKNFDLTFRGKVIVIDGEDSYRSLNHSFMLNQHSLHLLQSFTLGFRQSLQDEQKAEEADSCIQPKSTVCPQCTVKNREQYYQ